MANRDEDSGQYTETYPLEDFIAALEALDGSGTTPEITEEVGCKSRTTNDKMHELEDQGRVSSKAVGPAYLWILEDDDG